MRKSRAVRVAGFVGALGASAALVGFAATGTGAYFTDSHTGTINTSTGTVKVNVNPADGNLNFTNLLPGEYQTQQVQYQATGTGSEDIWLVFPMTASDGSNPSEALTGNPSDAVTGGLGRFGHLAVDAPAGSFTSYNLNNPGTGIHSGATCGIDGNGHGGSNQQPTGPHDTQVPFCAPASAILLSSGLTTGQADAATITFGYTPLKTGGQGAALAPIAQYKIVATQHGIRPDDQFNPAS
jgi:Camelysin metallo-endopeptidase